MLNTEQRLATNFFVGYEVEHTVCFGMKTLFVVGIHTADEIIQKAAANACYHIYFGTSQSFTPKTQEDWEAWDGMIVSILKKGFWVTLDLGIEHCPTLNEYSWNEFDRFIPMISVKIPNIRLYNYNATLKIDDTTWGKTNPGVWTHPLNELMVREKYTHWDQYKQDTELK